MPSITYPTRRAGCYLGESYALNVINQEIIIASGAGKVLAGTVLGQITASKKYVPHNPAATDGSQNAAAILFSGRDATSADATGVATVRGPATIFSNYLTYAAGISAANKTAADDALRAKGMGVLPQHAA